MLTSFTAEDQKIALETKWNGYIPLDLEEVETQVIIGMDINWLVDCYDVSLSMTGSNFILVVDDFSAGSFQSKTSRVSFNNVTEASTYKKHKYK